MTDNITTTVATHLASSPTDADWKFWLLIIAISFLGGAASQFFGRRLLYSVKPGIDPRSPEYRKLNLKVVILALVIVFIAIVANV